MEPDRSHLKALQDLAERLKGGEPLTPEAMAGLFRHLSGSIGDALNYARQQVAEGMSEVERARQELSAAGLPEDARELDGLLGELGAAQHQIDAGLQMSQETLSGPAELVGTTVEPAADRGLETLQELQSAIDGEEPL
ncbi:MAG: hypothetical protein HY319_32685 [Armatimonadetes bacterium]|nr:hypothetical protein [Armatimonadota bacterium]